MSDVELGKLHAAVESLSREFGRRMDRQDSTLSEIRADVKATNGTVIRHDEQIKALQSAVLAPAKALQSAETAQEDDEQTFRERIKFLAWGVGGGGAGVLALLKLIGRL